MPPSGMYNCASHHGRLLCTQVVFLLKRLVRTTTFCLAVANVWKAGLLCTSKSANGEAEPLPVCWHPLVAKSEGHPQLKALKKGRCRFIAAEGNRKLLAGFEDQSSALLCCWEQDYALCVFRLRWQCCWTGMLTAITPWVAAKHLFTFLRMRSIWGEVGQLFCLR